MCEEELTDAIANPNQSFSPNMASAETLIGLVDNLEVYVKHHIGKADILLITLDSLRFDVAQQAFEQGKLPVLSPWLGETGWERRHTPGNFTYAAHHAFFAGFLPTPVAPGPHVRLVASQFFGSETTAEATFVFEQDNFVAALAARGYHTICIGGVGFFNRQTALGRVLPNLFAESHWAPNLGVTCPESTENQCAVAIERLQTVSVEQRVFLFINVSAIHQPNYFYIDGNSQDSCDSQLAALAYVDRCLAPLLNALQNRAATFCILCSDHGTTYGEDGYRGHRLNHRVVGDVPYTHFLLPPHQDVTDATRIKEVTHAVED
ncbi:MAG: STM4013/SEN3800 family hydrolase [Pirellulaceae bacterium]